MLNIIKIPNIDKIRKTSFQAHFGPFWSKNHRAGFFNLLFKSYGILAYAKIQKIATSSSEKKKNEQADKGKNEQLDKKWTNGQIEGTLDFTLWIKKP